MNKDLLIENLNLLCDNLCIKKQDELINKLNQFIIYENNKIKELNILNEKLNKIYLCPYCLINLKYKNISQHNNTNRHKANITYYKKINYIKQDNTDNFL